MTPTFTPEPCKRHKLKSKVLAYVGHLEWLEKMHKQGKTQTQCPKCGRWLHKSEF
jgi:hypothetical protein